MRTLESLIKKSGGWENIKHSFKKSKIEDATLEEIKENLNFLITSSEYESFELFNKNQIDVFIEAIKEALDEIRDNFFSLNLKSKKLPRCVLLKMLKYTYKNDEIFSSTKLNPKSEILKPLFANNGKTLTKDIIRKTIKAIDAVANHISAYFIFNNTGEPGFWNDFFYNNKYDKKLFGFFAEKNPECKNEIEEFIGKNNIKK